MKKFVLLFLIFVLCPIVFAADKIDINTAPLSELDQITQIGPVTAQKIIDARPFSSVDDLDRVSGIGEKTLQKIKEQGLACVNCSVVIPSLTGNPVDNNENTQSTLDSRLRGNDNINGAAVYSSGILINEILPAPLGPDETDEWIELYNSNNFEVDLSGWKISDTKGTIIIYTIPKDVKISANSFLVFKRPDTKIMLNNDEDGLNLISPDGKITNSVAYTKAPSNQSYNKTASGWTWSISLTPSAKNTIATDIKTLSKSKNSVKNNNIEAGLADISLPAQAGQTTNPWFLFLIALAVTIISAAAVLIIKLKFKNYVRT